MQPQEICSENKGDFKKTLQIEVSHYNNTKMTKLNPVQRCPEQSLWSAIWNRQLPISWLCTNTNITDHR